MASIRTGSSEALLRFHRLLLPGPWDRLAPGHQRLLAAFRAAVAERGFERGLVTATAAAAGMGTSNCHRELLNLLAKAERWDAAQAAVGELAGRGVAVPPAMAVVELNDQRDAEGRLRGFSVRQRPRATDKLGRPDETIPDFALKRVSTLYGRQGEPILEWQIQSPEDNAKAKAIEAFVAGLMEAVPPVEPVPPPAVADTDLLTFYPMGDPHFGMRAHAPEAGDNFDLKRAEVQTRVVVDRLVSLAPPSAEAVLANLGDFFHADDNSARTRQSGNQLDVDGRWHEVVKVGAWTMVHLVTRLLQKHARVTVWNLRGNHDDHSAITLGTSLSMYFANEPRVVVADPAPYFHFFEFGANLIGATHGDGPKESDLPAIMAHDMPEAWGRTRHRVFHRGHFHHDRVIDATGCTVETHRTLAASDAWHRKSGYRARRDMKAITYHRVWGEDSRIRVNLERAGLETRAAE